MNKPYSMHISDEPCGRTEGAITYGGESVPAKNSTSADFPWKPVIYFYCLYIGIMLIGGFAGIQTTEYGAAAFLILLYARYGRNLAKFRMTLPVFSILVAILCSIIPLLSLDEKLLSRTWHDLIKYWALYFVTIIGLCLPLTPLPRAKRSGLLYGLVLLFLVAGWLWSRAMGVHEPRVQGFLINPNGFALTAMMLLLLIDDKRHGLLIRGANHLIVLVLIYVTHTSGALIGYILGMLHRYLYAEGDRSKAMRWVIMSIVLCTAALVIAVIPVNTFRPVDLVIDKIRIAGDNVDRVLSGKQIEYYEIIQKQGADVTSGVWRLYHWHRLWGKYWSSDIDKILVGYGVGTTSYLFNMKPHNDYLRLLLETGIVGFTLFLLIWATMYFKMEVKYRWAVLMVAVYCITENNYDHFPAMSLLVFYMLSTQAMTTQTGRSADVPVVQGQET